MFVLIRQYFTSNPDDLKGYSFETDQALSYNEVLL